MVTEIKLWTIGSDERGDVQLNIHIDGTHYTLAVDKKDVTSMQNIVKLKSLRQLSKHYAEMRVVKPIKNGGVTVANVGDVLDVKRDYERIGGPLTLCQKDGTHICDVDSRTERERCKPVQ